MANTLNAAPAQPETGPETKACAYDPTHIITRPPGMDDHTWRERKVCNRRCASLRGVAAVRAGVQPLEPKACAGKTRAGEPCAEQVRPREGEDRHAFRQRRYHDLACGRRAAAAARYPDRPELPATKTCAADPTHVITRPEGMCDADWRDRATCGRRCAARLGTAARVAEAKQRPPLPPKPCALAGCRQQVQPREGDTPAVFKRRRYHDPQCRAQAAHAGRTRKLSPPSKVCRCGCGKTVLPALRESQKRWETHHYATKGCANLGRTRRRIPESELETKTCGCGCGKVFRRNPAKQDRATFARRKYASHECASRARSGPGSTGRSTSSTPRKRTRKPTPPAAPPAPVSTTAAVETTWRPAAFSTTRDCRPRCDHGVLLGRACAVCAGSSSEAAA